MAAIVASTDDAVVSKTLDGVIQSWNPAAERIFGYTADEAIGQHITLIIPPDRHDEEDDILARLSRGERIEHFETIRMAKDGRRIPLSVTISPIRDASGRIVGASKVARDISARRKAEAALEEHERRLREALAAARRGEERFRTLADNISQFAWMADGNGSVFWYNERWFEYTGTTLEEMEGWGWTKVHHPDHVDRVVERISEAFATGQPWEDTFPLRGKDGSYRWFLSRAIPIRDESGKVHRWFGTNTDITERLQMEQALVDADQRKDHFLATLAHELRNPLAPILTGLELLRMAPDDPAMVRKVHGTLERQTVQLKRLVDDLLDVSRVSRDKVELRRADVALGDIVERAVETSRPLIESREHELRVRLPKGRVSLHADAARLTQALSNLLNNAAKYTPPGGRIEVTAEAEGDEVSISVADTGIGISREWLLRVFDLFAQAPADQGNVQEGLGIGLTLVKSLVELHGGRVEAYSEGRGKGSTFTLRLPRTVAQDSAPTSAGDEAPGAPEPRRLRVLVADDNRDAADNLRALIEALGYEATAVYDGAGALDAACTNHPDVAFLDLGMPELDGREVARRIRREPWGSHVTLVAVTGWGQPADRKASQQAGFDQHVVKPAGVDQLRTILQAADCGRRTAS